MRYRLVGSDPRLTNSTASMTVTQYLGTGSLSRGRMTITRQLNTIVSTPPYLRDEHDREAVIQGIANLRENLKGVANLTWITPRSNVTTEAFVDSVSRTWRSYVFGESTMLTLQQIPATPVRRCANHWIGKTS